jgi:hypothetical protein
LQKEIHPEGTVPCLQNGFPVYEDSAGLGLGGGGGTHSSRAYIALSWLSRSDAADIAFFPGYPRYVDTPSALRLSKRTVGLVGVAVAS